MTQFELNRGPPEKFSKWTNPNGVGKTSCPGCRNSNLLAKSRSGEASNSLGAHLQIRTHEYQIWVWRVVAGNARRSLLTCDPESWQTWFYPYLADRFLLWTMFKFGAPIVRFLSGLSTGRGRIRVLDSMGYLLSQLFKLILLILRLDQRLPMVPLTQSSQRATLYWDYQSSSAESRLKKLTFKFKQTQFNCSYVVI